MERNNNVIDTKDNPMKNFSKEDMKNYNYYKNALTLSEKDIYALVKEDREIQRLEKTCDILGAALKVEAVITLVVLTFAVIFNGFPSTKQVEKEYKKASISRKLN